ncbi:MAG: TPM domain-containing protein [Bdellovibrionota bacterium]
MVLKKYILSSLIFSILLGVSLSANAFDIPALSGPVIDEVGLLSDNTKRQLASSLFNLQKEHGVQLQVYITKSLQGEEIESAAIKIFDQWKLGDEKLDRGLLFLIAPNEKRLRIEVGQGLEGDVPDIIAKRIIADVVKPYFQRKEFNLGVVQGVAALQTYIGNPDAKLDPNQIQETQNAEKSHKKSGSIWIILIAVGIWLILFMLNPSLALYILFSAMSGGRGGGGGGSWSGGGGRSSGGGASGGW